jgi:hypothetical protein
VYFGERITVMVRRVPIRSSSGSSGVASKRGSENEDDVEVSKNEDREKRSVGPLSPELVGELIVNHSALLPVVIRPRPCSIGAFPICIPTSSSQAVHFGSLWCYPLPASQQLQDFHLSTN